LSPVQTYLAIFGGTLAGSLRDPLFIIAGAVAVAIGLGGARRLWFVLFPCFVAVGRGFIAASNGAAMGFAPDYDRLLLFGLMCFMQILLFAIVGAVIRAMFAKRSS
jgi:hypothetical protein